MGEDDDNDDATEASLQETIRRLRHEILLDPINKPCGATTASLKRRRELQYELEHALHQLAEVLESARVLDVQRQAIESGFVTEAERVIRHGECPLCLEEIPEERGERTPKRCSLHAFRVVASCAASHAFPSTTRRKSRLALIVK
jgi:DNA repair exonuclease SbcCD ATPase subunit